jgi:hypothetical protein
MDIREYGDPHLVSSQLAVEGPPQPNSGGGEASPQQLSTIATLIVWRCDVFAREAGAIG